MAITVASDYEGVFKTSQDQFTTPQIALFIDKFERIYLYKLFGATLGDLFFADLSGGVPQTQRFIDVFNPFQLDDTQSNGIFYYGNPFNPVVRPSVKGGTIPTRGNKVYISDGIKEMLLGFIYYEYNNVNDVQATPTGNRTPKVNAASLTNLRVQALQDRYNLSVTTYKAIQWRMASSTDSENYPEFNGESLEGMILGGLG